MSIPQHHFDLISGNTLTIDLALLDDRGLPVTDLVGATAEMQIRKSVLATETVFTSTESEALVTPTDGDVNSPSDSMVQFTISEAKTAALLAAGETKKTYIYGCRITYSDGFVSTILTGKLNIMKGVVQ